MNTLFSPITLNALTLPNRIVIPPMCMYSAVDGRPAEWHCMHYGHLAVSGAGLLIVEATGVTPEGRISPFDLGLWNDGQQEAHQRMIAFIRAFSAIPMAIQLAHAGRKASTSRPWEGGKPLDSEQGGWEVRGPSDVAWSADAPVPVVLRRDELEGLAGAFAGSAKRAVRAGYDAVELHAAHGYLLHEFLSPLSNKRDDEYGGSLENRMRFPLQVFRAVRAALPGNVPVGVRVSGTDFVAGGWDIEECAVFAKELEKAGASYIHVSGGGLSADQKISLAPSYQVSLAARVKQEAANLPAIAVGLVTSPEQADSVIVTGQADMVAVGRGMLYDPRWPWHAAAELGGRVSGAPRQYLRCEPRRFKGLFSA